MYLDDLLSEFQSRNFHPLIYQHSLTLYKQRNYFHAVFEAVKIYNQQVKEKSKSQKDGQQLMMEVWGPDGVLKVTKCETQTEKDFQNGIKFLSAGLMQAIRNPTAHEPAFNWPISKEDCLDLLSLISYLLRVLDKAVYYKGG
ncbi:MAG: TIGR02391 family protein [Candidatus Brocadia sp.]